jgi:hypothetical protein
VFVPQSGPLMWAERSEERMRLQVDYFRMAGKLSSIAEP